MPTVFISYAWDTKDHKGWVRRLAGDLRREGVDAWLDQWEVRLGDDVTQFMERSVSQADYVLLVCTENFARKADERRGGVGYEQAIVTSELLSSMPARGRFVCALRQGTPSSAIPRYMRTRLWVDFRDDATYGASLQQVLIHLFQRYDMQKPALVSAGSVSASNVATTQADAPPRCWVLVAGTGTPRAFSPSLEALSRALGAKLMLNRCGLITGGWPGVDEWAARSFSETAKDTEVALEDALVQVVVRDEEPAFAAGQLVFVDGGEEEWNEPIRRSSVVLLLGGVGGTWTTGEIGIHMGKPVLPISDTGGDAKAFYLHMLKRFDDLAWMGLAEREFQRLGRPGVAGIDAAVELALKVGTTRRAGSEPASRTEE